MMSTKFLLTEILLYASVHIVMTFYIIKVMIISTFLEDNVFIMNAGLPYSPMYLA